MSSRLAVGIDVGTLYSCCFVNDGPDFHIIGNPDSGGNDVEFRSLRRASRRESDHHNNRWDIHNLAAAASTGDIIDDDAEAAAEAKLFIEYYQCATRLKILKTHAPPPHPDPLLKFERPMHIYNERLSQRSNISLLIVVD